MAQRLGPGKLRRIPPAYVPLHTGALAGSTSLTFNVQATTVTPQSARLTVGPGKIRRIPFAYTSTGNLIGSTSLTFTVNANPATLAGSTSLTFTASATAFVPVYQGVVRLPGPALSGPFSNAQFRMPPRATSAIGALTGTTTLTFALSASFVQTAPIAGTTSLTFTPAGFPSASGALLGASSLTFTLNGSIIQGGMTGATSLTFNVSGVGLPIGLVGDPGYSIERLIIRGFSISAEGRLFGIERLQIRLFEVTRMALRFDTKAPSESVPLTFNFAPDLPSGVTLTGQPQVSYGVSIGTDANPSNLANGSAGFDATNTQVIVPVTGGITGVEYVVTVTCPTTQSNLVLTLSAILPVTLN